MTKELHKYCNDSVGLVCVQADGSVQLEVIQRTPEKPKSTTAWEWYEWALRSAVALRAKDGSAIAPQECHTLPKACLDGITAGWKAGLHAVEVIERIESNWGEPT